MLKFASPEEIENQSTNFLEKYHSKMTLPVPIEQIIEFQLGIDIVPLPNLFMQEHIDAFSSYDFKELYIDENQLFYLNNRARYSLAHEIGHWILHKEYIKNLKIDSIEGWKRIVLGKGSGHSMLETQANMFAGFLLMPTRLLEKEFFKEKEKLKDHFFKNKPLPKDLILAPFLARTIAKIFEVSEEAANNRLSNWIRYK